MSAAGARYAGIATRALALAVDVAIAQAIVLGCAAVIGLVASLAGEFHLGPTGRWVAAAAWALAIGTYFVTFWSTAGQTPAMRMMDIRVTTATGEIPGIPRSIVRLIGLVLAIIPFFAGFLPVLVDDRRRGIHDMMAGTVVQHGDTPGGPWLSAPTP